MTERTQDKLNQLEQLLPEGLIVDSGWMEAHGYSTALRSYYVANGWLKQPVRRVYQRPRGNLTWQQVTISLQTMLHFDLVVAARTALEEQGFGHYLRRHTGEITLTGPAKPPLWLKALLPNTRFIYRNDARLFRNLRASTAPHSLEPSSEPPTLVTGLLNRPWGPWNWPLYFSAPERAILEVISELPDHESFHQVDMLMEGMTTLSPTRLNALLADCQSIKVKRLFLFFADRHKHPWFKRLDRSNIDLGTGKRVIAKGGRYDPTYQITVPGDLDGLR